MVSTTALSTGCQTATSKLEAREREGVPPISRIFFASFEDVADAMQAAMSRYPPRIDNMEGGIFETDFIRDNARYRPPHRMNQALPQGLRYRILVRLVRGVSDGKSAIKVQISKINELQRDFFAEARTLPSDGFEEEVIMYRISRELAVKKAIRRLTERENNRLRQQQMDR